MAERLAELVTQVGNVRQLEAVVAAMRGIAASRAQRGRSLLPGIDAYSEVIAHAIGHALSLLPPDAGHGVPSRPSKIALVLFCAEQGFAGAFSERVLDAAPDASQGITLIVGTRGATIASERGMRFAWSAPSPTHVDAIAGLANRLADALYDQIATAAISKVDIVFARSSPGTGIRIDRHSLLPLDFTRFARPPDVRQTPLTTLAPQLLVERLAAEYVYAQLCEAAMHAFAAENEARMLAMASAKTNIGTKLTLLSLREQQLRQEEITTEIIELAAGAAALAR